ncbi:MAG: aminotransferase class V-fold PLP-dependent enzyme [Desulfobacterales bacterium]|nr:aminotransferase class V-fold PLP-dependent enzyme [Desulfobacterales bacterium]
MKPIYLDYNGTTPHDPEVIAAMRPFLEEEFGNPSSGHLYAVKPRQALDTARRQVAGLLNCDAEEVIFTSGGTEANNWAILGTAHRPARPRPPHRHLRASSTRPCSTSARFWKSGYAVTYLPVDSQGMVDIADVASALRPDTVLDLHHARQQRGGHDPADGRDRGAGAHPRHPGPHGRGAIRGQDPGGRGGHGRGSAVAGRPQTLCAEGRRRALHPQGRRAGTLHARRRARDGPTRRNRKYPGNRGAGQRRARSRPGTWSIIAGTCRPCATGLGAVDSVCSRLFNLSNT